MKVEEIIRNLREWMASSNAMRKCKQIEILNENDTEYRVIFHYKKCMAQLLVCKPQFAPFRFVSIEAVTIQKNMPHILYIWNDQEGDSIDCIIQSLEKGLSIVEQMDHQ